MPVMVTGRVSVCDPTELTAVRVRLKVPDWVGVPLRTSSALPVEPENPATGWAEVWTEAVRPGIEPLTVRVCG